MTRKTKSPEAAQKKVWKAELKQIDALRSKVRRDIRAERRRSQKETEQAERAVITARNKHMKLCERLVKTEARELANIERRIAILKGRIGI